VKTLLSLGALVLAIPATTISAAAQCMCCECFYGPECCVGVPYVHHYPVQRLAKRPKPQQRREKAQGPAPVPQVAKRPRQPQREEKAPPAGVPPALPPQ